MMTVPMPAWLRVMQQSFWWQVVLLPTLTGFGGSLLLQGCLGHIESIDKVCVLAATNATILTFATAWIKGHSVGSAQFANNGTEIPAAPQLKTMVDNANLLQTLAPDKTSPVTQEVADRTTRAVENVVGAIDDQSKATAATVANEVKP